MGQNEGHTTRLHRLSILICGARDADSVSARIRLSNSARISGATLLTGKYRRDQGEWIIMEEDRKKQDEKQKKPKVLTPADRVAWADKKEDLPPKRNTEHFAATKLPREVKRLLQVMMPTVPLEQMSITAGPEEIRHKKDKIEAYRHNGIDAQAVSVEEGQPQFKNWQVTPKARDEANRSLPPSVGG